jgi:phosphotransferase system enzyme I (PtsI)
MKLLMEEIRLEGCPISRGIAIGKPFFFDLVEDKVPEFSILKEDIEKEVVRYHQALSKSKEDIHQLQNKLKIEHVIEGVAILDAHFQMMQDPLITTHIEEEIRRTRKNAEFVFHSFILGYQKKFQSFADPQFLERFKDIQDIQRRVMGYLRKSVRVSLAELPPGSIVFSRELTASDTAEANAAKVIAFVTETGGGTSHAAIVAKAKGIPYVSSVKFQQLDCEKVIVDGRTGIVIFDPSDETLEEYINLQGELHSHLNRLIECRHYPPETYDGYQVSLTANIDALEEVSLLHQFGGDGVGLFRSEYIFLLSHSFPTEEEQFSIYKKIIKKMKGLPIVIRTFDFGGDKLILNNHVTIEEYPFLGCRAIRYLLKERDIFKAQLKAILRASNNADVSIMFPMISVLGELQTAKALLEEAKQELKFRGEVIPENIKVGCMIEVPSAVVIADLLAKECDFLSIGTNDLVQYSLAVDRGNHSVNDHLSATDPSVIRMIKLIVSEGNHYGIPVSLCGELASDPRFTSLLIGLGVHELSVAPRYIPVIKNVIRNTSILSASVIAEKALSMSHPHEILALLTEDYRKKAPEDRFYNC